LNNAIDMPRSESENKINGGWYYQGVDLVKVIQ
jgi:hypothetical protein